jgi:hypothetical protein
MQDLAGVRSTLVVRASRGSGLGGGEGSGRHHGHGGGQDDAVTAEAESCGMGT